MRRRSRLIAIGLLLSAVLAIAGGLGVLVKQVPDFYRDTATTGSYLRERRVCM